MKFSSLVLIFFTCSIFTYPVIGQDKLPLSRLEKQNLIQDEVNFSKLSFARSGGDVGGGGGGSGSLSFSVNNYFGSEDIKELLSFQKKMLGVDELHKLDYQGIGQTVMVIDSGVASNYTKIDQVVAFKDFTSECHDKKACDGNSHGTFVTDLILQMAPKAKIVAVKVLDREGKGSIENLVKALKWGISNANRFKINIINISLIKEISLSGYYNDGDKILKLVNKAKKKGIHVIVNSGNESETDIRNIIAASPDAITVGSYSHYFSNKNQDYKLSNFSNTGYVRLPKTKHFKIPLLFESTSRDHSRSILKPDVLAPGQLILGEFAPNSKLLKRSILFSLIQSNQEVKRSDLVSVLSPNERLFAQIPKGLSAILLNSSERFLSDRYGFMSGTTTSAALFSGSLATLQSSIGVVAPENLKGIISENKGKPIINILDRKQVGSLNLFEVYNRLK